jgi:M6 family metalloprotease-like protein
VLVQMAHDKDGRMRCFNTARWSRGWVLSMGLAWLSSSSAAVVDVQWGDPLDPAMSVQMNTILVAPRATNDGAAKHHPAEAINGWVNVLCKFADIEDEPVSLAWAQSVWDPQGPMVRYWHQSSDGRVRLEGGMAVGWFQMASTRASYMSNPSVPDLGRLASDCLQAAGASVDKAVAHLGDPGIQLWFNGSMGCCVWGGGWTGTIAGRYRSWPMTWLSPVGQQNLNVMAHEMAHGYGARHSNNADGDADTYDNPWDLLSDMWLFVGEDPHHGLLPKPMAGFHRRRAGWLGNDNVARIKGPAVVTIDLFDLQTTPPEQSRARLLELRPLGWPESRYLLLEAHLRPGEFGEGRPGLGVVVYDIDLQRGQQAWILDQVSPAPNHASFPSSFLVVGESMTLPHGAGTIRIQAMNEHSAQVGVDLNPKIFSDTFEDD